MTWERALERTGRPSLVVVGVGALDLLASHAAQTAEEGRRLLVVTDENVRAAWGETIVSLARACPAGRRRLRRAARRDQQEQRHAHRLLGLAGRERLPERRYRRCSGRGRGRGLGRFRCGHLPARHRTVADPHHVVGAGRLQRRRQDRHQPCRLGRTSWGPSTSPTWW